MPAVSATPAVPVTSGVPVRSAMRSAGGPARRCAVAVTAGLLLLPAAGCTSGDEHGVRGPSGAAVDLPLTDRSRVADGGTLRWAVDEVPVTLNSFQPDANAATSRIAAATLPALFTLDSAGRPQRNEAYLESAGITEREPRQTVVYTLNPEAKWSDGRPVGVADFAAQWKALSGKESAYWSARNSGYDRIRKVAKGPGAGQVAVTFEQPYADWKSLFTPLYPRSVMGSAEIFNEGIRAELPVSGGPFRIERIGTGAKTATLVRNPRWWGPRAKLERVVLTEVAPERREAALAAGELDLAEIGPAVADRIEAEGARSARRLHRYRVRRALEPAYTQLAMNGASGPLADQRVRRAVARALDRKELARQALGPARLPVEPLGSHLRVRDQEGYRDNSDALGGRDVASAQSLLADAGWQDSTLTGPDPDGSADAKTDDRAPAGSGDEGGAAGSGGDRAAAPVTAAEAARLRSMALTPAPHAADQRAGLLAQVAGLVRAGSDGERAREGEARGEAQSEEEWQGEGERRGEREARRAAEAATAARKRAEEMRLLSGGRAEAVRAKDGVPLSLRFLIPSGSGSWMIQQTGARIAGALNAVGIRTEITRIADEDSFRDHVASGDFDLALYSWPASAYPATDAQPIFAKPIPAPDGTLLVDQNYTRVGTDHIDQLFDQAVAELDDGARAELLSSADARIWAAAASVPLYQRPQLVAADRRVVNAGAFGFRTPRYEDIGYRA